MALKDKYLTISEAAKQMDVTRQTVSRWIKEGQLSAERIGRETLIAVEEIDKIVRRIPIDWFERNAKLSDWIRAEYGYSDEDTIEPWGGFTYIIRKKDGTKERVKLIEFTVSIDRERDQTLGIVTPSKVVRETLGQPEKKGKSK